MSSCVNCNIQKCLVISGVHICNFCKNVFLSEWKSTILSATPLLEFPVSDLSLLSQSKNQILKAIKSAKKSPAMLDLIQTIVDPYVEKLATCFIKVLVNNFECVNLKQSQAELAISKFIPTTKFSLNTFCNKRDNCKPCIFKFLLSVFEHIPRLNHTGRGLFS